MVYPLLLLLDASLASKNVWSEYAFQHFQSVLGRHNLVEFGHISSQILQHPLALSQDHSVFFLLNFPPLVYGPVAMFD